MFVSGRIGISGPRGTKWKYETNVGRLSLDLSSELVRSCGNASPGSSLIISWSPWCFVAVTTQETTEKQKTRGRFSEGRPGSGQLILTSVQCLRVVGSLMAIVYPSERFLDFFLSQKLPELSVKSVLRLETFSPPKSLRDLTFLNVFSVIRARAYWEPPSSITP